MSGKKNRLEKVCYARQVCHGLGNFFVYPLLKAIFMLQVVEIFPYYTKMKIYEIV